MKKLLFVLTLFISGVTIASFPVNNTAKTEQVVTTATSELQEDAAESQEMSADSFSQKAPSKSMELDDMYVLLLLWWLLGGFAGHRWYAGKSVGSNILFILTGGGCGIWAIIDLIQILKGEFMN